MTIKRRDGRTVSGFSEWTRNNPRLDSRRAGVSLMDIDWIWHQYLVEHDHMGKRTVNHILLIEEKSNETDLTFAEKDTMWLIHQALKAADGKKFLTARNDKVIVRFWGYYKLRYDGETLDTTSQIYWNKRQIDLGQLEKILLFKVNPDTLSPRSDRRHHCMKPTPLLK